MRNGGTVPHTALIYTDRRDRNRLLESYITRTKPRWDSLTVLSAQPDSDARYFRSFGRRLGGRQSPQAPRIVDVRDTVKGAEPAKGILSIVRESRKEPDSRPLIFGDWVHEVYGRFKVGLEVCSAEAGENIENIVCCYRGEGFWSQDCKQIARALELHRRVLVGSAIFEMTRG